MAFGDPLAVVAATAREMLVATAAARWSVAAGELVTANSKVLHRATNRTLTYGELAAEAAARPFPSSPRLKTPAELRLVGHPMPRVDARSKVDGTAIFGMDVRLPGMLTAALVLPPVYGTPLLECDEAVGQSSPGVIAVERFSNGVAVLARDFWSALKGATSWRPLPMGREPNGRHGLRRIAQQMRAALQGDAVPHKPTGDVQSGLSAASSG
jgi:CO/xanthine dehydrogenase Mo-binding subunit